MIRPTSFSLTEVALDFLQEQTSIVALNNINVQSKISLNNTECYTCDQTLAMTWQNSIVATEINLAFPEFNCLHLRLMLDQYKIRKCKITADFFQRFALVTNLNSSPVTINFYSPTECGIYYDDNRRMLYPAQSKLYYSMEMVPLTFYLVDQSIPHNFESVGLGQTKIFSASKKSLLRTLESNQSNQ